MTGVADVEMTASELSDRVSTMKKGESVIYFTGHLGESAGRVHATSQLRDMAQRLSTMWMFSPTGSMYAGMGMISLTQKKVAEGFNYIATRQ